ncbi:MAG: S8 family serine peptidase [Chitinophagaceae bacterium]
MKYTFSRVCLAICVLFLFESLSAQTKTNTDVLRQASIDHAQKEKALIERIQTLAKERGWDLVKRLPKGGLAILTGIDGFGNPIYTATENNIVAAATIGTSKLWPGGSTGLNLSGSSNNVRSKLAIWDGGAVRPTHVELTGRILQKDAPGGLEDHSTHVAGTMIATGVNSLAKGMSFGQQQLLAYDFSSDGSEMLAESPNLLVSNHSYGQLAGWSFNGTRWEFYGPVGSTEDYNFGYYSAITQLWDSIAYNAPNYLIVKSAGNKRDENGPAVGATYWRRNASGTFVNSGPRPGPPTDPPISNNDSYDIIPTYGTAKNILTVGAINPISGGYNRPEDVVMSSFSSWGPTDDGRIKPDVVADGVDVLSSIAANDNAYDIYSGTSMASPTVSGSLLLLQEYYNQLHPGNFMRSATLKGLAIHTAEEAGPAPGPDYQYGWGLVNMQKAAAVITANNTTHLINEGVYNGSTVSIPVIASGNGTIVVTLSWTDPKGSVEPVATALNNPTKKLVDDLDLVIKKGATTFLPWTLSPTVPSANATRGNNLLDNVEKVEVTDVIPGEAYTIEISHKGVLERGTQAYSLLVSGVGGTAYCASNPTSNAGSKIDSVSFAAIQKKNVAGCTTYSNFTTLPGGNIEVGQTIPIFIRLRSCDVAADKVVKVFIDGNNDGDFIDAGETLATSAVINGDGDYSGLITIPSGLTVGKSTILRIVMQETNAPAGVTSCGTYTKGETQDYRVQIAIPTSDVGITELISPNPTDCGLAVQYVTVRIANFGSQNKAAIPVTVVVKQGATTIATINATYPGSLAAGANTVYTLQTPFASTGGVTYTFTSTTNLGADQNAANNQNVTTVAIKANSPNPTGTAVVCSASSNTLLQATVTGSEIFTWYTSLAATNPIATGSSTSTTTAASPYYLAINDVSKHLGPANKLAFTTGGYLRLGTDGQLRAIFTTSTPMTIETARMYVGEPGSVLIRLAKLNSPFDYLTTPTAPDGFYFSDHPIDVYATAPIPPPINTAMNDPADLGAIYRLGINVPEAGLWALIVETTGTASLYRNNSIPVGSNYPYTLPGIINLEGNGATNGVTADYNKTFYYFFYDMALKLNSCAAAARVAIVPTTAPTPVITILGNVLTSNVAVGNQWYKNGGIIAGAVGQTYTAIEDGNYTTQVNTGGCITTSNAINFVATAIPNVDPTQIGLVVSPIPARGQFRMQLETRTKATLDISLVNTAGQSVYHSSVPGFIGKYSESIQPGKIAAGVYYLRVVHDKKMYIRKVVMVD